MKLQGVVKGTTIVLEGDPELPDGQRVVVELEIPMTGMGADVLSDQELENRIATDPNFEEIRQARTLRKRIAARLGGICPAPPAWPERIGPVDDPCR